MLVDLALLAVWLYVLLARGGFWLWGWRRPAPPAALRGPAPSVVAIIPARNEADFAPRAIASLAAQRYSGGFHIILIDDASTDGTAQAVRTAAPAGLLRVETAAPLPPGWTGKVWALAEGLRHAAPIGPDYYLFTDADIIHPPGNVESLAARAGAGNFDLVSHMATLHCRSLAERALVPAFVFFFFLLYPPAWIADPRRTTAGAAGGCILIRRAMLEKIGGPAAIAGELIDDCALAGAVKRHGGRVWLEPSRETRSLREYGSFAEMGRMISRTAFTQLRHSTVLLLATVAALAAVFLLPPARALTGRPMAVAAWLLLSLAYLPSVRHYRLSPLWAPFLPLVALFYAGATVHSAVAWWRGAGGRWKGRVQDTPRADAP